MQKMENYVHAIEYPGGSTGYRVISNTKSSVVKEVIDRVDGNFWYSLTMDSDNKLGTGLARHLSDFILKDIDYEPKSPTQLDRLFAEDLGIKVQDYLVFLKLELDAVRNEVPPHLPSSSLEELEIIRKRPFDDSELAKLKREVWRQYLNGLSEGISSNLI